MGHAEKQQKNVSDLHYQRSGKSLLQDNVPHMTPESSSVAQAIRAQRLARLKEEKERREALSKDLHQQAKWNGMSIEDNPIIQKKRYDDALHAAIPYRKRAKEDYEKAWFAQQESPAYLASKNVHQNTAVKYNQAETQFYDHNQKLVEKNRDYSKDYHQIK